MRIEQVVNADVQKGRLPGAVIAVARKGKLVYYRAFGQLDPAGSAKMPADAIFSIASMTKPMVAVGALELYERGLLKLDEPVATYLPQLAKVQVAVLKQNDGGAAGYDLVAPVRAPNITDLMRHTSGWAYGGRGTTAVHKMYPSGSSGAALAMDGNAFVDKLGSLPLLPPTSSLRHRAQTGDPTRADFRRAATPGVVPRQVEPLCSWRVVQ
jgi:CubicO group peptidase (beta-lactamase class C family)